MLLERGADPNVQNCWRHTAILIAFARGYVEAGRAFLHFEFNPNRRDGQAAGGHIIDVEQLLRAGIDPLAQDDWGRAELHVAFGCGQTKAGSTLLDLDIGLSLLDREGKNCLHHAAGCGLQENTEAIACRVNTIKDQATSREGVVP